MGWILEGTVFVGKELPLPSTGFFSFVLEYWLLFSCIHSCFLLHTTSWIVRSFLCRLLVRITVEDF